MKLVVMTQPVFFVEEDKILTSLFDEGMDCLHLSKPNSSPVYHERLLSLLPEEIHRRITVHEHYYLKNEYQLYSIHINDAETPLPQGYKGRFSRSCADIERLREAKKKAEYVLLEQDFEEAARRGLIDKHVYACGGMTLEKIRMAKELGFGGVVICSDLWSRFDIHNQYDYKELIAHFKKLRQAIG